MSNTQINYIHGIAEMNQRATFKQVPSRYIPYLDMTAGEMLVRLELEEQRINAAYFSDVPEFKKEVAALENALYQGIHGTGRHFVGALSPGELRAAKVVNYASRLLDKASLYGNTRTRGVAGINADVIDYTARAAECKNAAFATWNALPGSQRTQAKLTYLMLECANQQAIEASLNKGFEASSHQIILGHIPNNSGYPSTAAVKINDHNKAIGEFKRIGGFDPALVKKWFNVTTKLNNKEKAKITPLTIGPTAANLAKVADGGIAAFGAELDKGMVPKEIKFGNYTDGGKLYDIWQANHPTGVNGIGFDPVTITAILGAVTALIGSLTAFYSELRQKKNDAMSTIGGFATREFGPDGTEFDGAGNSGDAGNNSKYLLLAGAGLLGYYLLTD